MFKRFFSSLVLVATVALYGCGGGGSSSSGGGGVGLVQLVSITVTSASPSIAVGATQQYTAMGTYTDNSTKPLTGPVAWSSSDISKATIGTTTGLATAVAVGSTQITATSGTIVSPAIALTVTLPITVTTFAGLSGTPGTPDTPAPGTPSINDGTGSAARFNIPDGITTDGTSLYVADTNDRSIRKITAAGVVTTIASLGATGPVGITTSGTNLYVTEELGNTIRKIDISTGNVISTFGSGTAGSADGTGIAAQFNQPMGITTDGTSLYVADYLNGSIRKIVIASGAVTTFAQVVHPTGITMDAANLYVTDDVFQVIIKIEIGTGVQTIVAGSLSASGSTDGTGSAARFNFPHGITTDGTNLFVADSRNSSIRKIEISTGKVTTVATQNILIIPLGITNIGSTLYTTNNDDTIKKIQ